MTIFENFLFLTFAFFFSDKRPEQSIAAARASVMVYDDLNKKWVPAGSSHGLSKVIIVIMSMVMVVMMMVMEMEMVTVMMVYHDHGDVLRMMS